MSVNAFNGYSRINVLIVMEYFSSVALLLLLEYFCRNSRYNP